MGNGAESKSNNAYTDYNDTLVRRIWKSEMCGETTANKTGNPPEHKTAAAAEGAGSGDRHVPQPDTARSSGPRRTQKMNNSHHKRLRPPLPASGHRCRRRCCRKGRVANDKTPSEQASSASAAPMPPSSRSKLRLLISQSPAQSYRFPRAAARRRRSPRSAARREDATEPCVPAPMPTSNRSQKASAPTIRHRP